MDKTIDQIQIYITKTKLYGLIPLDIIAHFTVGALITIILLKFRLKMRSVFWIILGLSIAKEIHDYPTLQNTIGENIKDIFVSMLYPFLVLLIRKIKRSNQS